MMAMILLGGESALLFQPGGRSACAGLACHHRHAFLFIFKVSAHTSLHNSAIPVASDIV